MTAQAGEGRPDGRPQRLPSPLGTREHSHQELLTTFEPDLPGRSVPLGSVVCAVTHCRVKMSTLCAKAHRRNHPLRFRNQARKLRSHKFSHLPEYPQATHDCCTTAVVGKGRRYQKSTQALGTVIYVVLQSRMNRLRHGRGRRN